MFNVFRKKTRQVKAKDLPIGGGAPVSVQTMTNRPAEDIEGTIEQIYEIAQAGGELVRIAVPNMAFAKKISKITDKSPIPVAADIHFDENLALEALNQGVAKLRLNPGNLSHKERLSDIASLASQLHVPIRIGVNEGSISKKILEKYGSICPESLLESLENEVKLFEKLEFFDLVLSVKTFSLPLTLKVHSMIAERFDYPVHIGVTEAGLPYSGLVRSSAGIGTLLLLGIGDTVRVSLTGSPLEEVKAAWEILKAAEARKRGPIIISCPGCGRTAIDIYTLANRVDKALETFSKPITVAVMGCAVNGPGEARQADVGIAGGHGEGVVFRKGKIIRKVPENQLLKELMNEIENL